MAGDANDVTAWDPLPVQEVLGLFAGAPMRWWISGGYALESHVGRSWRSHSDIDVGVARSDAPLLARVLAGWDLRVAASGVLSRWDGREPVDGENNIWARRHHDTRGRST